MIELTCLRIKCRDCNRTVEVALPADREVLARQLAAQRWELVPAKPAQEAPQPGVIELVVEPFCPICEEARWRC